MNVHLIIIFYRCFSVDCFYPREGETFFTVKEPTLDAVCHLHLMGLFKMYVIYFPELFDLSNKQGGRVL